MFPNHEATVKRNLLVLTLLAAGMPFASTSTRSEETAPLGKRAPDFRLPDVVAGKEVRFADFEGKVLVLLFYSHTCTFCRNYEARFRRFAADHAGKNVAVFAVDSTGRPASEAADAWKEKKMGFPLLLDERSRVAAALGATAMTTACILDSRGVLRYVGAFDDCESGKEIRCRFVADAAAALLAGSKIQHEQTDVYGCMIPLPR